MFTKIESYDRGTYVEQATNLSYMPITRADIAKSTTATIENNAGFYSAAKAVGTIGGAFFGGAFGAILGSALPDLMVMAHNSFKSNDEFWGDLRQNYKELESKGNVGTFFAGAARGMSYVAGADVGFSKIGTPLKDSDGRTVYDAPILGEPVYESLPRNGAYTIGQGLGMVSSIGLGGFGAGKLGFNFGSYFIGNEAVRGTFNEITKETGLGSDTATILTSGLAHGGISALSAWGGFSLMPKVMQYLPWKYLTANTGTWAESIAKPIVNSSFEFGTFGVADTAMRSMFLDDAPITANEAIAYFGIGAVLGGASPALKAYKALKGKVIEAKPKVSGDEYEIDKLSKEVINHANTVDINIPDAIIEEAKISTNPERALKVFDRMQYRATSLTPKKNIIPAEEAYKLRMDATKMARTHGISVDDAVTDMLQLRGILDKDTFRAVRGAKEVKAIPEFNVEVVPFTESELSTIDKMVSRARTKKDKVDLTMSKMGYSKQQIEEYKKARGIYEEQPFDEGMSSLIKTTRIKSNANKLIEEAGNAGRAGEIE